MALAFLSAWLAAAWLVTAAEAALRGSLDTTPFLRTFAKALRSDGTMPEVEELVADHVERMRPVYQALPRSQEGYLEASAVRYLLHRYFVDRRGWFVPISGREEVANASLPVFLFGPSLISDKLSSRLATRGLSLVEVAAMAMTLEALADLETAERLSASFAFQHTRKENRQLDEEEIHGIMQVYLVLYGIGLDYTHVVEEDVKEALADVYNPLPMWDALLSLAKQVREEVLTETPKLRSLPYEGLRRTFLVLQDRYGRWLDQECTAVKQALKDHAVPGTGRVPLEAFSKLSLPRGWAADESREQLREMGVLDETDPARPSVVVSNYFGGDRNCEDPSKYYSVCCISECEALMKHLEHELGSPNAPSHRIVEIVRAMPVAGTPTPRELPEQLVRRLDAIAETHGGHAKLHGRLFRQWMHHAYPTECPFPFLETDAASIGSETPGGGGSAAASGSLGLEPLEGPFEEIPWFDHDVDYLTCRGPPSDEPVGHPRPSVRPGDVALLVMVCCLAWRLVLTVRDLARTSGKPSSNQKLPA